MDRVCRCVRTPDEAVASLGAEDAWFCSATFGAVKDDLKTWRYKRRSARLRDCTTKPNLNDLTAPQAPALPTRSSLSADWHFVIAMFLPQYAYACTAAVRAQASLSGTVGATGRGSPTKEGASLRL
ncbi:hypothetical protein E4U40_000131 [Claviceps sp. LM458 group G5]|nr:hypothetical protein E4U40_000131 [Claviceps sp. LM458 group G5]